MITATARFAPVHHTAPARRGWIARLFALDAAWRGARHLSALDDHALADIGLSPDQASLTAREILIAGFERR